MQLQFPNSVENEVIKYILQHPDIVTHAMRNVKTASQYSDSTSPGEHGDSAAVAPSPPEEPPENVRIGSRFC